MVGDDLVEDIEKHVHVLMFDESASKEYVVSTSEEVSTSDLLDIDPVRDDFDGFRSGGDNCEAVGSDG